MVFDGTRLLYSSCMRNLLHARFIFLILNVNELSISLACGQLFNGHFNIPVQLFR